MRTILCIAVVLVAAPVAAAQPVVSGVTPRRAVATTAALTGLASAVFGALALTRSARRRARVAVALGSASLITGGLVVVTAPGGLGTGGGLAGGVVAMALGLTGIGVGAAACPGSQSHDLAASAVARRGPRSVAKFQPSPPAEGGDEQKSSTTRIPLRAPGRAVSPD